MNHKMETTPQNQFNDASLLEAAVAGDTAAFTKIVEQHQAMVFRTCLRVLRNEADAQDATQATFIILHQKCQKLKQGTVLGGWLYRTAELVCREFIRSAGRRKRREEETMTMNETNPNNEADLWDGVQPQLDLALTALAPKYRDVVVLRYLEGKSTQETASAMGMSSSVVTTRLARAVDQLRAWFHRRGVAITGAALSLLLVQNASAAAIPPALGPSILGAVGAGTTAGASAAAASSANTGLMVKAGLAKLGSVSWWLLDGCMRAWMMIGDLLTLHRWAKSGFRFPRWVHIFAVCMLVAGVAGTITMEVMGMLTLKLAVGCIFVPPAAAYIGWVWMWGPGIESNKEEDKK
jgi:RNA polymerase sigma factor (sigma-70 family)